MTYDSDHKVCLEIGADLSGTVVKLDGWVLEDVGFYWTRSIDQMSKYVFDWLVTAAIQINSRKLSSSKGWRPEEFSLDRKLVSIKITFISKHYTESWSNWRSGGRLVTAVLAVTGTTATGKLACGGGGSLGPAVTAVSAAADTRHLAVTQHHPRQHGCLGLPLCRILKCDYRLPGSRWELDNAYFIASCRNVLSNGLNCHSRCHGKLSLFAFSWLFKCFIAEFPRQWRKIVLTITN